uniref:Neurotransmitter-gated ion-channel ligand-binding domain-containing protein n=1 Tax=Strigamia maritima TaxID=126957 RepID=T1J027_STRMM
MLLVLFLSFYSLVDSAKGFSGKEIADLIPKNYTTIRESDDEPVILSWTIYTHLVSDLSLKQMEFSVDLTIQAVWTDDQLHVRAGSLVNLPTDIAKKLWYPWIKFENCKNCKKLLIDPNVNTFHLIEKQIIIEIRNMYTFTCIFDLRDYPFDEQHCNIDVELGYWNGRINIDIDEDDFYDDLLVPPEYWLVRSNRAEITCEEDEIGKYLSNNFCFRYTFVFKRLSYQHVLMVFLPSTLIVILSWLSFWLDIQMAAPRIALGLTSLLTLATQFNAAQKNVPAVATVKALDIWMFTCIFMVFASLLVYALAYRANRSKTLENTIPVSSN